MRQKGLRSVVFSLLLLLALSVSGQSPSACLRLADQAYETQNPGYALELYERVLFFQRDSVRETHFLNIARCYVSLQLFDKAADAFQTCAALALTDSARSVHFLKAAWCMLARQSFQESLLLLYNLPEQLPASLSKERNLYIGIATYQLGQFTEAQQAFRACYASVRQQQSVDSLFTLNHRLGRRFRPRRARVMSFIVPGSGHLYAGDIKNGLNSLVLLSGLAILGVNYSLQYTWLDSLVSIAPWFQRYYVGGLQRAERATAERLQLERMTILRLLITGS